MPRLLSLLLVFVIAVPAQAQAVRVEAPVEAVTVFLRGAQVTRAADAVAVPRGTTTFVFSGLTPHLDPRSLQFRTEADVTVLSVVHRFDYLAGAAPEEEIAALETQRDVLRDSLDLVRAMHEVFEQEEALLLANRSLGGTEGVEVSELREAAAFFRDRLTEIKRAQLELRRRAERIEAAIADLDGQLAQRRGGDRDRTRSDVEVTVLADAPARGAFALSYLTPAAAWSPRYDARVDEAVGPVRLDYHADVQQTTGEDWRGVLLSLSTGDPARPGTRPELSPWRIGFAPPVVVYDELQLESSLDLDEVVVTRQAARGADAELQNLPAPPPVRQVTGLTTTTFEIDVPYTIPSDGKEYAVAIRSHDVPALYEYYAAPKLDPHAYLTARLTDWADLALLPGPVNLFLDGAFVGTTRLDAASTQDTLVLSLGRDDGVAVERERVDEFTERTFLGGRRVETFGYEIALRNNKGRAVSLVVVDQVPLTTDDAIDVRTDVDDGGVLDEETGRITWRLILPPGATETLRFRYEVRYPRDRRVVGL